MNDTFDHWQLALIQRQEVTQDSNHRPDFHDFFWQMIVWFVRNDLCSYFWLSLAIHETFWSDGFSSDIGHFCIKKNKKLFLFALY